MRSWIKYGADSDFPIENLPYGVFHLRTEDSAGARVGVAIGDYVADMEQLRQAQFFDAIEEVKGDPKVFGEASLNRFMALGRSVWKRVRIVLQNIFAADATDLRDHDELKKRILFKLSDIVNLIPCFIGDYSDFYASREHATNMGRMFRPDGDPLLPNWLWIPIGYHGRASSVVVSGTPIRRPRGQGADKPTYKVCAKMDFELEVALFVGPGNNLGDPIKVADAEECMFGIALMNDWSARDIQPWEMAPLGPFTAKNLGTTISPWIVTLEALEPFRVAAPEKEPAPLEYLVDTGNSNYDIHLEVHLATKKHTSPVKIAQSNFKYMYWSMKQQHTVTGCNMRPGDLLGSGTISGPDGQFGSMIEASQNGKQPITLPGDETRGFLEDGDTVILRGWAQGDGFRVGFGECVGEVLPAH